MPDITAHLCLVREVVELLKKPLDGAGTVAVLVVDPGALEAEMFK